MTNPIIPEVEVLAVKKVIEAIEELKELHKRTNPIFNGFEDDLDRVHILVYLHATKDLVEMGEVFKSLLGIPREDFEKAITNNGEFGVKEALLRVMTSDLIKLIG